MAEGPSDLELRRLQLKVQLSNVEIRKQQAVCVRNACKRYGSKRSPVSVLEDLSMTVPNGSIYGLLGASGCGKTTLVNCIIGRKRLNSGEIWVLGGYPDTKGSGVPGPRIGYMPQQVSLYGEFSVRETMKYFGWITGMSGKKIEERLQFLMNLLMLPNADDVVKTLSGGQQRRVSLAVALLHEPELLILDEPTVGLDPVLREVIWNHLIDITQRGQATVILTTHYIDETRQANLIGLMRGGYIVDEESPQSLLRRCDTETLENAFLKISVMQNLGRRRRSSICQEVTNTIPVPSGIVNEAAVIDDTDPADGTEISGEFGDSIPSNQGSRRVSLTNITPPTLPPIMKPPTKILNYLVNFKANRIKALLWKNFTWFLRNIPILITIIALPIVFVALFFSAIGREPVNLPVAVVNHETNNMPCNETLICNSTQLSCTYLAYLQKRALNLIYYDSEYNAIESVKHGETFASIIVRHNYSAAFKSRLTTWDNQDKWDIIYSTIDVFRDVALKDIAIFLKLYLFEGLEILLEDYFESCGKRTDALAPPIKFQAPVYGIQRPEFIDFMTPAAVLSTSFFMALGITAVSMLSERKEGILERSLVVGVNPMEILIAHTLCDSILVIGQVTGILVCIFGVFKMTILGSLPLVIILSILTGFCGMCLGFAVSSGCDDERTATSIVAGVFLPTMLLSGLIWPTEGMHYILQAISPYLPFTKPTESLRSILQRGWNLYEPTVYQGFICVSVWILIFLIISALCLKFKKG